jgi:type IV pilus assembly protein PilA
LRRENGFSLMELLIVVAIILIIAAIAVPNLLRARLAANESSAVHSVRQISTAELSYNSTYPQVGYAVDLKSLGGPAGACSPSPATACILDSTVSGGSKSGYSLFAAGFSFAGTTINTEFVASAAPAIFNKTGVRNFCAATDNGSLRWRPGTLGGTPAPDVPTCLSYPVLN